MALAAANQLIGKKAPDFPITVLKADGAVETTTLRELTSNGLPTVLDFFTTWCAACPAAAKKIEAIASGSHAGRSNFILVSLEGEDGVLEFAKAHGIERCLMAAIQDDDLAAAILAACVAIR